ncbi:DJ-1/PfpI family protein [Brachyspira aalborgi]|uniref:Peptidase n=1 Tax=Brachyspira aalborgi TaxID=29522 RepID=A0A5C8G1R9_9SPIR|nr:DJ-1/PfpI family protein [Brachyspira aalborgi]TXJ55973.1 peptidase [Brachyspira aalborgi]
MEKTNNILYVIAYKNFQDEEYFETKKIFENSGYKTTISSSIIGEGQGKLGSSVNIELLFSEVDTVNFDAIIFVGGLGCITLWDDWRAQGLAKLFLENKKIVAGIGSGVVIMANAGILKNIKAACSTADESHVRHGEADIVGDNVVISGNIITAEGSKSAKEFANTLINVLKNNN